MTILDRLLSHDAWTTRQLLLRCRELSDEQMEHEFDIGDRSVRETFDHLIGCMERHTDFLMARSADPPSRNDQSIDGMLQRLTVVAKDFADIAARVEREGRADEIVTNPRNGRRRPMGALIAHIITHGMHHRAQILYARKARTEGRDRGGCA